MIYLKILYHFLAGEWYLHQAKRRDLADKEWSELMLKSSRHIQALQRISESNG